MAKKTDDVGAIITIILAPIYLGVLLVGLTIKLFNFVVNIIFKEKNKNNEAQIPVISADKEMTDVYNYLTKHYLEYCNYEEILKINEEDRLPLMQLIWQHWGKRGVKKKIKEKYPQYKKADTDFICIKENARIYAYYHWIEHQKNYGCSGVLIKIGLYDDWRTRFCDIKDEINVFNTWEDEFEITQNSLLVFPYGRYDTIKLETEYIYFWRNGEYIKMTPEEFKKFCKVNNYDYPFHNN